MQYVLLSPCGPLALTLKCLYSAPQKDQASARHEMELQFGFITVYVVNHASVISIVVKRTHFHMYRPTLLHCFCLANTLQRAPNLFVCL